MITVYTVAKIIAVGIVLYGVIAWSQASKGE